MKWHHLERHLDPLAKRQRTWRTRRALAVCWVVGLIVAAALWALGVNSIATLPALVGVLIIVAVLAVRRATLVASVLTVMSCPTFASLSSDPITHPIT